MALSTEAEDWMVEIIDAADELEHFTSTHSHQKALEEIFEEVERYGGRGAVQKLGEDVLEWTEKGWKPDSATVRRYARSMVVREFEADIPGYSPLLKTTNG